MKFTKIVFFNHFHNGDVHYSRQFVKDIMSKYPADYYYYHKNSPDILKDIKELKHIDKIIEHERLENFSRVEDGDTLYINTWVGQNLYKYIDDDNSGISLVTNYKFFKETYDFLGIKIEENLNFYIPTINFEYVNKSNINRFINDNKEKIKILISNGKIFSNQGGNLDFNPVIDYLSDLYPDIIFILTDQNDKIIKSNVIYTDDIIKMEDKNDLNEIAYLSTFCDVIIGRASGPYAFCFLQENLRDKSKIFMAFITSKYWEWLVSDGCRHIISSETKYDGVLDVLHNELMSFMSLTKEPKMRIAFTIILNGQHHLEHNNYAEFIAENFDYWVIVEGATKNNGSTQWCKDIPEDFHKNGKSVDGTVSYIKKLKNKHDNIILIESDGLTNCYQKSTQNYTILHKSTS